MDFDDPFSDPVATKVPTTTRFQPKAKQRPKKGPLSKVKDTNKASLTSAPQDPLVDQSFQLQPIDNLEKTSDVLLSSSMAVTECLEHDVEDGSISVQAREVAHSVGSESMEVSFSDTMTKDLGVDDSIDIVCPSTTDDQPAGSTPLTMDIDDPFSESTEVKASTTSRFQPKAKLRPKKRPLPVVKDTKKPSMTSAPQDPFMSVDTSSSLQLPSDIICPSTTTDLPAEISMPHASNNQNDEELPDLTLKSCNSEIAPGESINKILQDSEWFEESLVAGNGDFQIDMEQLEADEFSCLDTIDMTSEVAHAFEKRAVKYKPKPKALSKRQRDSSGSLNMKVDGNFSPIPSDSQPDTLLSEDTESLSPEIEQQSEENLKEKESSDGYEGSELGNDTQDGANCEFHDNSNLNDGVPKDSLKKKRPRKSKKATSENDGDNLEEESLQKKRPRKSKKATSENDKPARKRKKEGQEANEAIVKAPQKFPRGTRRKRCVDKSLLEAPEDELDLQRVPIRDLIIFAEYKERQAKKQASTTPLPPPSNESTENTFREDPLYEENGSLGFDENGEAIDNPSTSEGVTKDTGYFNYQTYMTKEPRAKWTMHDTELFYKGISQFGSDLSMIQQLFPGRTRHQIKLKYKKEERQNPMRLNDALANRAQDLSHFELVITRLQEQAAEEAKSDKEDSDIPENKDEETEVNTNNEDVANSEQDKQGSVAEQEPVKNQVESPSKSYYSEDEEFDWSAYKSEL